MIKVKKTFILISNVNVILSEPPLKELLIRFPMIPLNLLSEKNYRRFSQIKSVEFCHLIFCLCPQVIVQNTHHKWKLSLFIGKHLRHLNKDVGL